MLMLVITNNIENHKKRMTTYLPEPLYNHMFIMVTTPIICVRAPVVNINFPETTEQVLNQQKQLWCFAWFCTIRTI